MRQKLSFSEQILHYRSVLSKIFPAILVRSIEPKFRMPIPNFFNRLHQIKTQNLNQLIGPHTSPENFKTFVGIPEKLPVSDLELEIRPH